MSDQIILKSVGSYLDTNGHVGPLDANGLPDPIPYGVELDELDADWIDQLNESDLSAVNEVRKDHGMSRLFQNLT